MKSIVAFQAYICLSLFVLRCTDTNANVTVNSSSEPSSPWSLIVVADFHGAETFSFNTNTENNKSFQEYLVTLSHIHAKYGGEVMLLPGDTNNGRWSDESFLNKRFPGLTPSAAVYQASINCYTILRKLLNEAGYDNLFMAIGDHELGGNDWFTFNAQTKVLDDHRRGFRDGFNSNQTDKSFFYEGLLVGKNLTVPTTPWGTDHERISHAYQYKNILFVTIDLFETVSDSDYVNKKNGRGGEGIVSGTLVGDHLIWFENVLKVAREGLSFIDHIVVQAHLPAQEPVRKVRSSGMTLDDGEDSEFWKLMVKYGVDLYLAGEVHSTTASKDKNSTLVQIASRGNSLNSFLKIEVDKKTLLIKHFQEVGSKPRNNRNYKQNGILMIDKSKNITQIDSSGVLKLLDLSKELIRFDFEMAVPLYSRRVTGLKQFQNGKKVALIANSTEMRGIQCNEALPNLGEFGQPYDAQIANLMLRPSRAISGNRSAYFKNRSTARHSIYAFGPHSSNSVISFAIWLKTFQKKEMIIVHYGAAWYNTYRDNLRSIFSLTIRKGKPRLYVRENAFLTTKDDVILNDGQWHHIAVSMPETHCSLSEVNLYIDGKKQNTKTKNDEILFFIPHGRISLGGLGYSSFKYDTRFPKWKSYQGSMDEFILWGRSIDNNDLARSMHKNFDIHSESFCEENTNEKLVVEEGLSFDKCHKKCKYLPRCFGYEYLRQHNETGQCSIYYDRPLKGLSSDLSICASVK